MYKVSTEHLEKIRDLLIRASIILHESEYHSLSKECEKIVDFIDDEYLNIQS